MMELPDPRAQKPLRACASVLYAAEGEFAGMGGLDLITIVSILLYSTAEISDFLNSVTKYQR